VLDAHALERVLDAPRCWRGQLEGPEPALADGPVAARTDRQAERAIALRVCVRQERSHPRRLHAGAVDLAPLTTLMDAARLIGDDVRRLVEAQREVSSA
jgi:hypothetical protein